jgi:hypothetical protein
LSQAALSPAVAHSSWQQNSKAFVLGHDSEKSVYKDQYTRILTWLWVAPHFPHADNLPYFGLLEAANSSLARYPTTGYLGHLFSAHHICGGHKQRFSLLFFTRIQIQIVNIILIVEDLAEERKKAKDAVVEAGYKPAVAETLADAKRIWNKLSDHIVGIVTDGHFPEDSDNDFQNPNGLSIVSRAVHRGVFVSVCTDIDHHYAHYLEDTLEAFSELAGYQIPTTLDSKNWDKAVSDLHDIIQNYKS